jgi:hypothetical protein
LSDPDFLHVAGSIDGRRPQIIRVATKTGGPSKSNFLTVIYGLDDGILTCLDLATGEPKWKDDRYGHGQLQLVRDS